MASDDQDAEITGYTDALGLFLRVGTAGLLLGPGLGKFLTYRTSVQFFERLGIPAPELLVPVVGAVEVVAAAALLLDRAPRVVALAVVPVMAVAALTAGPSWQNLGVLAAALVLVGLETASAVEPEGKPTR